MNPFSRLVLASLTALTLALAGCATQPFEQLPTNARPASRWTSDAALQGRIMALDPAHISDRDVREVLAKGPTPRVMLLHGGVYPVHLVMESFGAFLTGMGYPEAGVRDPGSGDWSYSPYLQTSQLVAGRTTSVHGPPIRQAERARPIPVRGHDPPVPSRPA